MTVEQVQVRRGMYADSVTLMQVSQQVSSVDGVRAALVAMATELNLELLAGMGFSLPDGSDSANDLLIAVRADEQAAVDAGLAQAEALLTAPRSVSAGTAAQRPPRSMSAAARTAGRGLALISVPGQHAFAEAMDALDAGCDVLLFSDNVEVWQEVALKEAAGRYGLLVMGPDCGTAVVGGVGLGFSHTLDRGPVGLVAASGTGAQQLMCLLDAAEVGVSAALGVGGRDLSQTVGGRSTRSAMRLLDDDPETELIVVVSKPAASEVTAKLRELAAELPTPVQFAVLGEAGTDLTAAAEQALNTLGVPAPDWAADAGVARPVPAGGVLRGLFCGGTLCDEAMTIAAAQLGMIRSNIPLRPEWTLDATLHSDEHSMIDFGEDSLTLGRPHPMIDPTLREDHLRRTLDDARTGVVLLDVVLGHGAHSDPVAGLLPIIESARVPVVVSLIGARRDPQDVAESRRRLLRVGASVFASNAQATRHALSLLQPGVAQ